MSELVSCIHSVPVFKVLPQESVERLHRVLRHEYFDVGEHVLRTGEPIRHLIVVQSGLLQLNRTSRSGREQVLRELGAGQFYGEMALFTDVESEGDLIAVRPTNVCMLDRHTLQAELKAVPQVVWPLLEAIALRLSLAERTIGELALYDVGERLAAELIRLAESGRKSELGIEFELPVTWAQLATRLGTTPESLSRRLKQLQDKGYLQFSGRQVVIHDLAGLQGLI